MSAKVHYRFRHAGGDWPACGVGSLASGPRMTDARDEVDCRRCVLWPPTKLGGIDPEDYDVKVRL